MHEDWKHSWDFLCHSEASEINDTIGYGSSLLREKNENKLDRFFR